MTDKLEGIKPGDRVRVTFEARVHDQDKWGWELIADSSTPNILALPSEIILANTFHIERIEPPLVKGDKVRGVVIRSALTGEIHAVMGDHAWVLWEAGPYTSKGYETNRLSDLERIA